MLNVKPFTRKRELSETASTTRPFKKNRLEKEFVAKNVERRFKKRRLAVVVDELCTRIGNNDRQLTNNLLRELESEHIRNVNQAEISEVYQKLIKACLLSKIETIAQKVIKALVAIMKWANVEQWMGFLRFLEDPTISEGLAAKTSIDSKILEIYVHALGRKYIEASEIPHRITQCARRAIFQADVCLIQSRINAIEFLVSMAVDEKCEEKMEECEILLCNLTSDRDFRTRSAAADGLWKLSQEGHRLSKSSYQSIKDLLKDSESVIRIRALNLLLFYANLKPPERIGDSDSITITDDCFSAVCDAMNDIELSVRVEAARKLGEFEDVSEELIYQTLDKKMMTSNKASQVVRIEKSMFAMSKKSAAGNDKRWRFLKKKQEIEPSTRGGWSRGKELNAACPDNRKEKEEEEEDSIIPHGACGAFVTALEDEFMDVRKEAVYSLGKLAANRPSFAISALEYLADMFNDEIAEVRLDAINALTPLIAHGQMNSEQLNVILKCLDDGMAESRQAMRELLTRAQFADVQCIEMCVKALLACLKRFPKDKDQIFGCMGKIGANHSIHVQSIMRNLLGLHLLFHTKETSIEDVNYVGQLVMVLNAASQQPAMVYVMPEFVHRHYRFLRLSSPHLVQPIRILDDQQNRKVRECSNENLAKAEEIVLKTYSRLCESSRIEHLGERNVQRGNIFSDASAISSYNEAVSGAARLICCLDEITVAVDSVAYTVMCSGEIGNIRNLIRQHLDDIQSVEHQFSGISTSIHCFLIHCRVYLSLLDMIVWMMTSMIGQAEVIAAVNAILVNARRKMHLLDNISPSLSEFIETCESAVGLASSTGGEEDTKQHKIWTPSTINQLLEKSPPQLPPKFPPIRVIHLKYAEITTPNKDAAIETALRFFSNMPHGIGLEATLYNLTENDLENVRVKVSFPDGNVDISKPRDKEIRKCGDGHQIATNVKVACSSAWTDAAEIDIILGLVMPDSGNSFVPFLSSPSSFTQSHVRVKIYPVAR